ncbi:hypothetical protein GGS26DRAFT_557667 [Hypomontagnella submonticulosa]|nr:hypothetical protein GGS26DRAFT_557667 [Hypomontagnella submonticulosa]
MHTVMAQPNDKSQPIDGVSSLSPNTYFDPLHQSVRLFFKFLGRWLLTAAICAAFAVVLNQYDRRVYLQDDSTHIYNAVTAGLTICLSLNIDSSLNSFAAAVKWVIIAQRPSKPRVFELILGFDSSKVNVIKLLIWRTESVWWLRLICLIWLLIALGAQVGTALIGLTYSMVPLSPDSPDFPQFRGNGSTALFTEINFISAEGYYMPNPSEELQRSNAFAYGVGTINSPLSSVPTFHSSMWNDEYRIYISGIPNYPNWSNGSLTQWNAIGRYIENHANCDSLRIRTRRTESDTTVITFDGYNGTQGFTIPQEPLDYATYISDISPSCGPRCAQVYVIISGDNTDLFICNSTVSEVYDLNKELISQQNLSMPEPQARILAGAIGWGDINVNSSINTRTITGRFQASSFPAGSYWAPVSRPDSSSVEKLFVAHFTAATIGAMDEYGLVDEFPDLNIPGVASQLDVKWSYSDLILALIPGLQALLALICIAVVHRYQVPVHDASPLAMTKLLAPVLVDTPTGSLQSGSEIAKEMTERYVYTYESTNAGNEPYRVKLVIGYAGTRAAKFPRGMYV